ncbi:hypothetical protein K9U39_10905 [Rhodoblastus acidophilus]|uniref:Phage tail protein n=1 Tax=Candidatus Rhodoblastus alkanivorans TaxID=2954117 RepID=A0ABS9Z9U0_9HYPH|nr:hypothetical protein [Candidatus Rhodoblastus alkanivorans]MCI4680163.1 hypothetical protein [Candidatus Rhodoblastus alkanivorans]MCI4684120.1 hypothetical protein [Candidatus Rhodoblastus alkanivorans]MDI4641440.1 hypothetical protein [Rhodoblastus acidophilus]
MTVYYLKDANGNLIPVNSTPIGPQPGASSLCVTPASDAVAEPGGLPISGISMPSGGAGLTGWLSAIWKTLTGTLSVSWTGQSVGVSSLPALPAGSNVIGRIGVDQTTPGTTNAVYDTQSAPFAGAVAMTPGTIYAAARSVGVLCTVAGNVTFQFSDSSTATIPVSAGWQTFPFACMQIVVAGTTASATYYNLK